MAWINRLLGRVHRHEPRLWGLYEINCARCGWWLREDGTWIEERPVVPNPVLHPDFRHGRRFPS